MPTHKHRTLGPVCKMYRHQSGLSQKQVATALGYSTAQIISNFERGLCGLPTAKLTLYGQLCQIPETLIIGTRIAELLFQMMDEGAINKKSSPKGA